MRAGDQAAGTTSSRSIEEAITAGAGVPEQIAERFAGVLEPGYVDHIALQVPTGDMSYDEARRTVDLFARRGHAGAREAVRRLIPSQARTRRARRTSATGATRGRAGSPPRLAGDGNARAAALLESDIAGLSTSRDVADRRIAAQCLAVPTGVDRAPLTALLRDPEPAVRADGLAAVGAGDTGHVEDVVAALEDPATCGAAVAALGRLGDAVLPSVATALAATAVPVPAATVRLARGVRNASPEAVVDCLGPHVEHPDRELGLAVRSALAAAGVETAPLAADIEPALRADAEHAARCLAALAAVTPAPLLERALRDELELLRERVLALLAVRHGAEAIHLVALGLASDAESRRSLAIEMLE